LTQEVLVGVDVTMAQTMTTAMTITEEQQWEREEAEDIIENLRRIEYESVYDPRDSPPVFCSLCGDDVGTAEEAYDSFRSFNDQTSHLCDTCFRHCDSPDNRFVSDKEKKKRHCPAAHLSRQ
jgi:hypothetical protein